MYDKILVPLDGSQLAECVLPHVETVARGCGTSEVIFLRVVEPVMIPVTAEEDISSLSQKEIDIINGEIRTSAENYLGKLVKSLKYDGVNIRWEVTSGKATESITEYAVKNKVDLIAIATHGRSGVSRWIWGSVAERVLRSAGVPVLMITAPGCSPEAEK
ncbi:MAG: universal stress protein [Dehalococcoidales bacterium]|nr:universal stress protein [Dehalococcoidales bacterium]